MENDNNIQKSYLEINKFLLKYHTNSEKCLIRKYDALIH